MGTVFRDDFDRWDSREWHSPIWAAGGSYLPNTQLRVHPWHPTTSDGTIKLQLDTHNPTAVTPGDSFQGSEIISEDTYGPLLPGESLEFTTRFRLSQPVPSGAVISMFLYQADPVVGGVRSEIDGFEVLTSMPETVVTNVYKDDPFDVAGDVQYVPVARFDATEWHTATLEWSADAAGVGTAVWQIDGQEIRRTSGAGVPVDKAMTLRFNVWCPSGWPEAQGDLTPVGSARENQSYQYELDWVTVEHTSGLSEL